ncbi:MAG: hypothetical protein JWR34_3620 [Mycobacterium sp.]|nr:hypothetical protein [Mycobacterium sp.]
MSTLFAAKDGMMASNDVLANSTRTPSTSPIALAKSGSSPTTTPFWTDSNGG